MPGTIRNFQPCYPQNYGFNDRFEANKVFHTNRGILEVSRSTVKNLFRCWFVVAGIGWSVSPHEVFSQIPFAAIQGTVSDPSGAVIREATLIRFLRVMRTSCETATLSIIGEVFNLFNIANVSGYNNMLNQVNYGQPSARAGQVFGSGGPRAFQFATRLQL